MGKFIILSLLFVIATMVNAADLTTLDGKVYKYSEVKKCAAGFVYVLYEKGEVKIDLQNLPENFIAALSSRQRNALRKGADLQLADGKFYKNCNVTAMGNNSVTFSHDQGTVTVPFNKLSKNYQATFNHRQIAVITGKKSTPIAGGSILGKTADGKIVYSGIRGGRYYNNRNGKKVYLRRDVELVPVDNKNVNAGQP